MTEIYPDDSDLNALDATTDAATGLPYLTIAESPFYTHRFKLFNWLARVLAFTSNALRVYKDGDLTFGVRAGKYKNGDTSVSYTAVTAQSLTNNQTNYIYLTAAGVLTVNTTGFPEALSTEHVPLATIVTSAGEYDCDDIVDYRDEATISPVGALSGILRALPWQAAVDDELDFTSAEPSSPSVGDRYLNTGSGASSETAQTVAANDVEQWNGTNWTEITPTEGYCLMVLDRDMLVGFDGSSWIDIGTFANIRDLTDGGSANALHLHDPLANAVADPGDAGAIAVTETGSCPLVTAGAETRTLAIPTQVGREISLNFKTDGGDCVVTVASALNQAGNNTLTFAEVNDMIRLQAIDAGAALAWRVVCNDGVALSTV